MTERPDIENSTLSRRGLLVAGAGALAGLVLAACSSSSRGNTSAPPGSAAATDFSQRFAKYQPADEPNGDLVKVVWPDYVTAAGPEVNSLYEFQITHGELMRYMPCFCGCGQTSGHRSNRDCFIKAVHPDGTVEFDQMAPTCDICLGVASQAREMLGQGSTPRAIRTAVDRKYADKISQSTPTPYPPA
jgi:hypothetical protein